MFFIIQCNTSSQKSLCFKLATHSVITVAIFVLLSACGGYHSQYVYKLYPGPELPDSDVATLKFGNGVHAVEIDGLKVSSTDYGAIKLVPGVHSIRWEAMFLVSVMVNASGFDSAETNKIASLSAGHTYTIEADRTTGHGYRMYLWIENVETGEVVAGVKKP
jgi:hypothetical protein